MPRINHYKVVKEIRQDLMEAFKEFKKNNNKKAYKEVLLSIYDSLGAYMNSEALDENND